MGRLRSCEDADFIARITAEVTDLFGTEDASLHRFIGAWPENLNRKDSVWDEPTSTPAFKEYKVPVMWQDWNTIDLASELGLETEIDAIAYISRNHLLAAGVPQDQDYDYVSSGDVLEIHTGCGHQTLTYDIVQCDRDGWINSTDQFTQYKCSLKRKQKYEPERKLP